MKIARLAGMIFGVVLALSLVTVAAASAADPEFKGSTKQTFKTTSGTGTLESSAGTKIVCTKDGSVGEVQGASKVGKVVVTFTGCNGEEGGSKCTAQSAGAKTGEIITKTLDGELGLVAKTEAASGVGLLLLPESGKEFVSPEGSCLTKAPVEGSIAGEASPIGVLSTTGKLSYTGSAGSQGIKEITVLGSVVKPKLSAFLGIVAASEDTSEEITYAGKIEVA
jgi:hypothetical protein